tara:strand:+ start:378 stop:605 length:228 start_codon:yes stop_codon:yes gene_type:complete
MIRAITWLVKKLTREDYPMDKSLIHSMSLKTFAENKDLDLIRLMHGMSVALFGNSSVRCNLVKTSVTTGSMSFPA